jgi:hypothetical protein
MPRIGQLWTLAEHTIPAAVGMAHFGGMAEWTMAAVLKTVVAQVTVGSNPTPSADLYKRRFIMLGRCQSGRLGLPAKQLGGVELPPGFESLPPRLV